MILSDEENTSEYVKSNASDSNPKTSINPAKTLDELSSSEDENNNNGIEVN